MPSRRDVLKLTISGLAIGALMPASVFPAHAKNPRIFTGLVPGIAVGGYDTVAYFTDGKPVKGSAEITAEHEGAVWHFANKENRDAFKSDPAKFAPQYGGYCAYAMALNALAKGEPEVWDIVDGKLYLNFNKPIQKTWNAQRDGYIKKADANWPEALNN